MKEEILLKRRAVYFIVTMGIVSLFADITYEGARSITGPFFAVLGATGAVVGIVSGFGEWIGYAFRLLFGYAADKTGKYWTLIFVGYAINVLAVPLLALAGNWEVAAALIIIERFGKAIRSPSKDAILSYAAKPIGRGWGFGIHEAMDQIGAVIGPLLMALVLYYKEGYQFGFALLLIPAILTLLVLFFGWRLLPNPVEMEKIDPKIAIQGLSRPYWIYVAGLCFVAAGFVDFPLIAFHFKKSDVFNPTLIPILYAVAMGVAGLSSLVMGKVFDAKGISVIFVVTAFTAFSAGFVFLGGFYAAIMGMLLWGIGLGAQESIMRAFVANLVGLNKRATAYGMLNIWFGSAWLAGSIILGLLYDVNVTYLVIFSVGIQIAALPFFYSLTKGST